MSHKPVHGADILLCWVNVHGGRYHALLHLRRRLQDAGLSCEVLLNRDAPLGLQLGIDVTGEEVELLARHGAHVLSLADMAETIRLQRPKLCLFDSHAGPDVPRLIALAKDCGAMTAQASTLLADFTYHGADHLLIQHPLSLWIALDYSRDPGAAGLVNAQSLFFSGSVFYEPLPNTWTSSIRSAVDFQERYGLDPAKPTALWLPNREDGLDATYGQVVDQARRAGFNILAKLHPWEYKQIRHGFDPYGMGMTSAQKWGVPAVDERDTSWALSCCDAGIMRGSSLGLELPYWKKPGIYLPFSGIHLPWHAMMLEMTKGVAAHLEQVEDLEGLLSQNWPMEIDAASYESALRFTRPWSEGGSTALDLHVRHLCAIMEGRSEQEAACTPRGRISVVRRCYEHAVPPTFHKHLRPWQRLLLAARKGLGLLPGRR